MCVYTTTDPPGIRLFLRLPASRTSPDTRPLSKEERWHWSHSGVKVTFFHRTWRSHRLPHTPISLLFFFVVHSHYIFLYVFFLSHLNMPFPAFFPVTFLCTFERFTSCLNVDPLLDQSCFVRDFLIMGADWRGSEWYRTLLFWLPWGGYKVIFMICLSFIVSKDSFSLLNSIEKVRLFGWTCSLKSWSAEGRTRMWSDHINVDFRGPKLKTLRRVCGHFIGETDMKRWICSNVLWMLFLVNVFLNLLIMQKE